MIFWILDHQVGLQGTLTWKGCWYERLFRRDLLYKSRQCNKSRQMKIV